MIRTLACVAALLGTVTSPGAAQAGTPATAATWPSRLCAPASGHVFARTTVDLGDAFIAQPPSGRRSVLTAAQAYAHFVRLYGRLTAHERSTVQVRYGRITVATTGAASASRAGTIPITRRVPGWVISTCSAVTPPPGDHRAPGHPGRLVYVVADTRAVATLGWKFEYRQYSGTDMSWLGGDGASRPAWAATRYYSTPWTLAARSADHRRVLLHFQPRSGYCFDHVDVQPDSDNANRQVISVVLSTAAHQACSQWSRESRYMDAVSADRRRTFSVVAHGPTGPARYVPVRADGARG